MKTGIADLPLHPGRCPPWLFKRMRQLAAGIGEAIICEFGTGEFLRRLSSPFFFQSFGCVLGFDWHSSGLTTTVCGALKEGLDTNLGVAICGGKGKVSRKTPEEIKEKSGQLSVPDKKVKELAHSSKMAAKVDSAAVQDGYQLYHHVFMFTEKGEWTVIQQGLNDSNGYARRYHWLSETVSSFVEEPHEAICCDSRNETLNMVARESREARAVSVDFVKEKSNISRIFERDTLRPFFSRLHMPPCHSIPDMDRRNKETLRRAYELQPKDYEELLSVRGMGPKTIRALALVADIVYGKPPSWEDPARFSFAHGGKDGIPYPVDRMEYGRSIEILRTAVEESKIGRKDKMGALKSLEGFLVK